MSDEVTNEPFVVESVDDIKSAMERMVVLVRALNRIDKQKESYLEKYKERRAPILEELAKLRREPKVLITHLKPSDQATIEREIEAWAGRFSPRILERGDELEF